MDMEQHYSRPKLALCHGRCAINLILITTGGRPDLLRQSLESLRENATDWSKHTLTVVVDGSGPLMFGYALDTLIIHARAQGASASRNIGAGSIPKYRRQEHVMFLDDDVWASKGWDERLERLATSFPRTILSPYSHPYNQEEFSEDIPYAGFPLVISSVAMMMPWDIFDEIGPWDEPGGANASEDFQICARAKAKGYSFAVTRPHAFLHTGLTNSKGEKIVGYDNLKAQNDELAKRYGVKDAIIY